MRRHRSLAPARSDSHAAHDPGSRRPAGDEVTVKTKTIDEATAATIAENCEAEGNLIRITAQLARPDYEALNKVLTGLGGKWNRKAKAHVFPFPIEEHLAAVKESGTYVDRKSALGFFETPEDLAASLMPKIADSLWCSSLHMNSASRHFERLRGARVPTSRYGHGSPLCA